MKILGVIPARFESIRLPGKPLKDIEGKSLIQRVYEQADKADDLHAVVVATDDKRIQDEVIRFGGNVVLTRADHPSGTDRCYEAAQQFGATDAVVNIQGDEPFIRPEQINAVCALLQSPEVQLATLVRPFDENADPYDVNTVKVVFDKNGKALYFSRSVIPFNRNEVADLEYYQHIGVYGYRSEILSEIIRIAPSPLELAESLEQLRWLENGYEIHVSTTEFQSIGVDTPEDLERAREFARTIE